MKKNSMKKKSRVRFKYVHIYHFSRCLGIDKVPERGNNPLGMESSHFNSETVDINKNKFNNLHIFANGDTFITKLCSSTPKPKNNTFRDQSDEDTESIHSVISIDYTSKSLQPLNPIQRKKCLENAGVDININDDILRNPKILTKLRENRKQVGCKCSNSGTCDTNKCICSIEGISCQSDGNKFPCKCGDRCSNKNGKRIYSHAKIKCHYHHTFDRIMNSSENVDCDTLSTINGDCVQCENMSEDEWKKYPEISHQTRSRKRAGEQETEILKTSKQMIPGDSGLAELNGTSEFSKSNILPFVQLSAIQFLANYTNTNDQDDSTNAVNPDLMKYPIVSKKTSAKFCATSNLIEDKNKENIDLSPTEDHTINTLSSKLCAQFKSPLHIQVPSGSFVPTVSPIQYRHSNSFNKCDSSNYSVETDCIVNYNMSFLNNETFDDNLLSPSVTRPSPLKFNPISLAPEIRNDSQLRNSPLTIWPKSEPNDELSRTVSISIDLVDSSDDNLSAEISRIESFEVDKIQTHSRYGKSIIYTPPSTETSNISPTSVINSNVTTKLELLDLTRSSSSSSSDSSCKIISPTKGNYSFRPNKNAPNYLESPMANYGVKRKNGKSKLIRTTKCPDSIMNRSTNKHIIKSNQQPHKTESLTNVIRVEEINFFDIQLTNPLNLSNYFKSDDSL